MARYVLALAWQLAKAPQNSHEARETETEREIALLYDRFASDMSP